MTQSQAIAADPWIVVHFLCVSGVDNLTPAQFKAVEVVLDPAT
ncbi:MAG TPA: hypothetical protein VEX86_26500 [Longimicrobium sp.]|nr:hypothetical protein [Longimicrobium sp.]